MSKRTKAEWASTLRLALSASAKMQKDIDEMMFKLQMMGIGVTGLIGHIEALHEDFVTPDEIATTGN